MQPHGSSWRGAAATAALAIAVVSAVGAAPLRYDIDVPAREDVSYTLPLAVEHPGRLQVEAVWPGGRIVSFRLERPDGSTAVRRSGPSPQSLHVEIGTASAPLGAWTLAIRALPAEGGGAGSLVVTLPELAAAPPAAAPPPPAARAASFPAEPWLALRPSPPGSSETTTRLFRAVETWRLQATDRRSPDACRWQLDLLRYGAARRDALADRAEPPPLATRRVLFRLAHVIRMVDWLRTTHDPAIAGPPPEDAARQRTWEILRREQIGPLEFELDAVGESLQRGHAPELQNEAWAMRLLSCVTACERFFEERVRVGADRATNRELADSQWTRILTAAELLEALAATGD
ncbi:MAG TPA: hypothetical protein VJS92_18785 [Candidatus Polarisedimenticolaceae bacterium]|nr:hypothetical protein [Candidatus Polarisedimenticolaceae bacterium]